MSTMEEATRKSEKPDGPTASPEDLLRQADAHLAAGRAAEAEQLYRESCAAEDSPAARVGLARCAMLRGEHHRALLQLQQAEGVDPDHPTLARHMGVALVGLGLLEQGRSELERAIGQDPDDSQAWRSLANLHHELGDDAACLEACDKLQQLEALDEPTQALQRQVRRSLATSDGSRAPTEADSNAPDAPGANGSPAAHSSEPVADRVDVADLSGGEAPSSAPPSGDPLLFSTLPARDEELSDEQVATELDRADAHLAAGRFEQAEVLYRRHLSSPEHVRANMGVAHCTMERGAFHQALSHLQAVERARSDHEGLPAAMAQVLYGLGCFQQARVEFERAIAATPEDRRLWQSYSSFLKSTGDYQGAVDACRRILSLEAPDKTSGLTEQQAVSLAQRAGEMLGRPVEPSLARPAPGRSSGPDRPTDGAPERPAPPTPESTTRGVPARPAPAERSPVSCGPPPSAGYPEHEALEIPGIAGALAGGLAHAMNNLMTDILGLASVVEAECSEGDARLQDVRGIIAACQRGRTLTQNLRSLARSGKRRHRRTSLRHVVKNVVTLLSKELPPTIQLDVRLDDRLHDAVGDAAQLTHALTHLCVNAMEAMAAGGTLTITADNTVTEAPQSGSSSRPPDRLELARIRVADTGPGMDADMIRRCFDPFVTTKRRGKGAGLGLSLVYGTIVNHGGTVTLNSAPGRGTAVVVCLPAASGPGPGDRPQPAPRASKRIVLLVDDDPHVRRTGKRLLETLGHEVMVAGDGEEALEIYGQHQRDISLVVLDLVMPKMDGAETYARLLELNPQVEVLLASGFGPDFRIEELLARGVAGFLEKPFHREELARAIAPLLDPP